MLACSFCREKCWPGFGKVEKKKINIDNRGFNILSLRTSRYINNTDTAFFFCECGQSKGRSRLRVCTGATAHITRTNELESSRCFDDKRQKREISLLSSLAVNQYPEAFVANILQISYL